jgi:hypothetical protein
VYQPRALELPSVAIKVTWCACARCLALGPRWMTLNKGGHETTVALSGECCGNATLSEEYPGDD